jgi:hypothetical protein
MAEEEEEAIVPSGMWLFCSAIIVRIIGYKTKMFLFLLHVFLCHRMINIDYLLVSVLKYKAKIIKIKY